MRLGCSGVGMCPSVGLFHCSEILCVFSSKTRCPTYLELFTLSIRYGYLSEQSCNVTCAMTSTWFLALGMHCEAHGHWIKLYHIWPANPPPPKKKIHLHLPSRMGCSCFFLFPFQAYENYFRSFGCGAWCLLPTTWRDCAYVFIGCSFDKAWYSSIHVGFAVISCISIVVMGPEADCQQHGFVRKQLIVTDLMVWDLF